MGMFDYVYTRGEIKCPECEYSVWEEFQSKDGNCCLEHFSLRAFEDDNHFGPGDSYHIYGAECKNCGKRLDLIITVPEYKRIVKFDAGRLTYRKST